MSVAFADTFYFLALVNARDAAHLKAIQYGESHETALVTTAWVPTELANALADLRHRHAFGKLLADLEADRDTTIVPPSAELFAQGVQRYNARIDKEWSLTDCISFVVLEQRGITDALAGDHHFEQAGFRQPVGVTAAD